MKLSEELTMIRDSVRRFAKNEVAPRAGKDESEHRFQKDLVLELGRLGFLGCPIPEEYGGSNSGFLAHAIVTEEIARVSGSLRAAFNMQTMGTAREICQYGTESQKQKYVAKLVSAELLGSIHITEPDAGSDVAGIKTKAVKVGDRYVLSGSKTWITYADVADLGIVYAYTNPKERYRGLSAFIVDLHSKGVSVQPTALKMGWHACPTGQVFFDDVEVPAEDLLGGEEGKGFACVMGGLDNTRLTAAAGAVGVCQGLIDEAIKYCGERKQFGQEIGKFQMVQEELARMIVETEAARQLTYKCATEKDEGDIHNTISTCMAKYYSCDVASRVADGALRILGAYGYSSEYPVERMLRDAKLYQVLEGSANVMKMVIATTALGYRSRS